MSLTTIAVITPDRTSRALLAGLVQRAGAAMVSVVTMLSYMVGEYSGGCRLFAAPVDSFGGGETGG